MIGWPFLLRRQVKHEVAWQTIEPLLLMAEAMPAITTGSENEQQEATVSAEVNVKDILIALAFLVILVSPAFAALNVFTGKNRF